MTGCRKTVALANAALGTGSECSFAPCKFCLLADSRLTLAALAMFFSSLFMYFYYPGRTAPMRADTHRGARLRNPAAIRGRANASHIAGLAPRNPAPSARVLPIFVQGLLWARGSSPAIIHCLAVR